MHEQCGKEYLGSCSLVQAIGSLTTNHRSAGLCALEWEKKVVEQLTGPFTI